MNVIQASDRPELRGRTCPESLPFKLTKKVAPAAMNCASKRLPSANVGQLNKTPRQEHNKVITITSGASLSDRQFRLPEHEVTDIVRNFQHLRLSDSDGPRDATRRIRHLEQSRWTALVG